ncbi:MAG: antioxidant AhpC [Opitutus sp.]|nr:antioxidant AhpC [Opitutus sp.]
MLKLSLSAGLLGFLAFVFSPVASPAAEPLGVGAPVPAALVRTVEGEQVELRTVLGGRPTVLIFYRGGWCPYCTKHLAALAEIEGELRATGFQVVALSPDRPEKLRAKPSHAGLNYTLLSDSKAEAMRAFGIAFRVEDALVATYKNSYGIDLEADSGESHHLLPHPAVFLFDATGVTRFAHVNPDYKLRLSGEEILAAAQSAKAPAR